LKNTNNRSSSAVVDKQGALVTVGGERDYRISLGKDE
jgi:hypothetical protein